MESKANDQPELREPDLQPKIAELLRKKSAQVERSSMSKNIFFRSGLEKLAKYEKDINQVANSTRQDVVAVLEWMEKQSIPTPWEIFIKSMHHWKSLLDSSNIPPEMEIIENLQNNFHARIVRDPRPYIPPDPDRPPGDKSKNEPKEKGDDVNRINMAIEAVLGMVIDEEPLTMNDLKIRVSAIPEHSGRTRPYWMINIKKKKILILLNNQFGNRTFVCSYKKNSEIEALAMMTKEQLKAAALSGEIIHDFIFDRRRDFMHELKSTIEKTLQQINILEPYPMLEQAKAAAQKLGIKSFDDYRFRHKEDPRLPPQPQRFYKDFIDWFDFLGKEKPAFVSFEEARKIVKLAGIIKESQYRSEYRKYPGLPSFPNKTYPEFTTWYEFLDIPPKYETIEEARIAFMKLGIKTIKDYHEKHKEDPRLPGRPDFFYKISFREFLTGKKRILKTTEPAKRYLPRKKIYRSFQKAKEAAQRLGIKNSMEYREKFKQDPLLIHNPQIYPEFTDWADFLGNSSLRKIKQRQKKILILPYETYEEICAAVRKLGIKTAEEYGRRYREDIRLPCHPEKFTEFEGWPHLLGKEHKTPKYETFDEICRAVQNLKIPNVRQYRKKYKEDPRLPSTPQTYEGFTSWRCLFEYARVKKLYETLDQAKTAAQKLGIRSFDDYRFKHKEDPRLPSHPQKTYKDFIDWYDFLGKERPHSKSQRKS